ncbi:hypothetical protein D9M68_794900 [compost metagenome]
MRKQEIAGQIANINGRKAGQALRTQDFRIERVKRGQFRGDQQNGSVGAGWFYLLVRHRERPGDGLSAADKRLGLVVAGDQFRAWGQHRRRPAAVNFHSAADASAFGIAKAQTDRAIHTGQWVIEADLNCGVLRHVSGMCEREDRLNRWGPAL